MRADTAFVLIDAVQTGRPSGEVPARLVDPCHELAPARMPMVDNQAGPMRFDLIQRQSNRVGIEFSVIEKGQFAEPLEFACMPCEPPCKPVGNRDVNKTLLPTRVEDHRVERMQRSGRPRGYFVPRNPSFTHIEKGFLIGEARLQFAELGSGRFRGCRSAVVVAQVEKDTCGHERYNDHNSAENWSPQHGSC